MKDFFGGQEPAVDMGAEAVVVGAAKYAAQFVGDGSSCCGCGNWQLTHLSLSIVSILMQRTRDPVSTYGSVTDMCDQETHDGLARVLIPRNSMTPLRRSHTFRSTSEDPSIVAIKIYEGERVFAHDNRFLGELRIDEVPPGVSIEVFFEVDVGFSMLPSRTSSICTVDLTNSTTGQFHGARHSDDSRRYTTLP